MSDSRSDDGDDSEGDKGLSYLGSRTLTGLFGGRSFEYWAQSWQNLLPVRVILAHFQTNIVGKE